MEWKSLTFVYFCIIFCVWGYCLMFTANGTGGFGSVFDFTIK